MRVLFLAFILLSWGILCTTHASIVAVVDSGVDVQHVGLAPSIWTNPIDVGGNWQDEDDNGFLNDIHGWNFIEDNDELIDSRYTSYLTPDVKRFFEIQSDLSKGNIDRTSILWAKKRLRDRRFQRVIAIYSNFMHGTHVSGIATQGTKDVKLLGVKLGTAGATNSKIAPSEETLWSRGGVRERLSLMVELQIDEFLKVFEYLDGHYADVVNLSLGISPRTLAQYASIYADPFDDVTEIAEEAFDEFIAEGRRLVAIAPKMLFVIAAGNDGMDNDITGVFPANINAKNTITVAATHDDKSLASFSNYGKTTVDIAAPGVAIRSTVPGDEYLSVSGTSQATPFVSRAAAMIKDSNPSLSPSQIKKILMETVTKKEFLVGKVVSEGVLHQERAVYAAKLSNVMDLDKAIAQSLKEVRDTLVAKGNGALQGFQKDLKELVLPLPSLIGL